MVTTRGGGWISATTIWYDMIEVEEEKRKKRKIQWQWCLNLLSGINRSEARTSKLNSIFVRWLMPPRLILYGGSYDHIGVWAQLTETLPPPANDHTSLSSDEPSTLFCNTTIIINNVIFSSLGASDSWNPFGSASAHATADCRLAYASKGRRECGHYRDTLIFFWYSLTRHRLPEI